MKAERLLVMFCAATVVCAIAGTTEADLASGLPEGIGQGAQGVSLEGTCDYDWWYGCSPTSGGMMLGYYDRNGYNGLSYSNLVPGGVAETNTYPSTPGRWDYLAQYAIASPGHVYDFYGGGGGAYGDDRPQSRPSNCLADFMGTSQDAAGRSNGSTTFHWRWDGGRLTYDDICQFATYDEVRGLGDYIRYSGYKFTSLYTQLTDNQSPFGFTFDDYKAEIDAGRVVLIGTTNHLMAGVGYEIDYMGYEGNFIRLYNTWWSTGQGSLMFWGGTYAGSPMFSVIVCELTGGEVVPLPGALLLGALGLSYAGWRLRHEIT